MDKIEEDQYQSSHPPPTINPLKTYQLTLGSLILHPILT